MITVTYNDQGAVTRYRTLAEALGKPEALAKVVGRAAVSRLKAHFRNKDRREPNRLGGQRQHFWLGVATSVSSPTISAGGGTVRISIADPRFAQKVFGGVITAKRGGALTIPVSPEAYGRTARTFEHETGLKLFLLRTGGLGGNKFATAVLASARGGGIQVEYVLKKSVNQRPDPSALPDRTEFEAALLDRAEKYVVRKLAEAGRTAQGGTE